MLIRRNNITRCCQEFDSKELEDFDDEEKWIPKKKKKKNHFETYRISVYCLNCYNEGHFTKECKLF
jgi:DNA-directed RNA polymerase alpha subunit